MDRHVRWLRRVVLARIVSRLAGEAVIVGAAVGGASVFGGLTPIEIGAAGLAAGLAFAVVRLAAALHLNPINTRYLRSLTDTSHLLTPVDCRVVDDEALATAIDGCGMHHLVTLGRSEPDERVEVYTAASRLVLVAVAGDGETYVIVSRLTDGRVLTTSRELVVPNVRTVVNRLRTGSLLDLMMSHVERLEELRDCGITARASGYDVVVDQLRSEWHAWDQIGPLAGPLVAIDTRRRPLQLSTGLPEPTLWARTSTPVPTDRATDGARTGPPVPPAEQADDPVARRLAEAAHRLRTRPIG